jgi:hypothetical protein
VPEPPAAATPPSNPVTSSTVLHDMGSGQPAGSPFAPKPILGPNGQAVSAVQAPAVENQLRAVSPQTPVPTGPAKDFLVTRTPSPGTPAVPESLLDRILKTGVPAGAGATGAGETGGSLLHALILDKLRGWTQGRDANLTKAGGG